MATTTDATELLRGARNYLEVLRVLHEQLRPALYLEIGVRNAHSLRLALGDAIGVDPSRQFQGDLPGAIRFHESTSDGFFEHEAAAAIQRPVEFAFIDGMHLFEYALRDFINVERHAAPWSLVVFDDVCPNHVAQATRERGTKAWMGDIWKIRPCLEHFRPDLRLLTLDTWPSGMLAVTGLDPGNRVLHDAYGDIVDQFVSRGGGMLPTGSVLRREGAVEPTDEALSALCRQALVSRDSGSGDEQAQRC